MEKQMKRYVALSYIVFWFMVLGLCGTASMVFHCSPVVMRILSNVCAWAPTIVLLIGFKYFCPGQTISEFYKKAFGGRYSFIKASVIQGVIWAFWHTILWFVDSDYMGIQMIPYILSNVIVMTGLCFVMNYFMEKNDNLIYGIVIHFCFNFLYCFLQVDIWFYAILSVVYILIIALICLKKKAYNAVKNRS